MWKYKPVREVGGNDKGQCPCHGSMYDPVSGKAIAGPASLQAPPSNTLPTLYLETDDLGNLWIKPAEWNVNENGVVGYGRFLKP
jgi:ubiquinol-cytochrome c reductase iron-sulfur subunit